MYFKSEFHKNTALKLMNQFGFEKLEDDLEYGVFCYLATATYKYNDLKNVVSPQGIDLDTIEQNILHYSPTEMGLIRFGLQLFSSEIDDITLMDLMPGLDEENKLVVIEAIKFRFNIIEP